ncbi:hypothetical protein ILYODFUR_022877 [Ilyodon furcidens]|uniref:Uncharacterized protein n=1 Tax=Ilyodon furcidens TaxID=33524 RepID=A0ABV0VJ98_9TELE
MIFNLYFHLKGTLGPLSNCPVLLTLTLVQEWLNTRTVTVVAHCLGCLHGEEGAVLGLGGWAALLDGKLAARHPACPRRRSVAFPQQKQQRHRSAASSFTCSPELHPLVRTQSAAAAQSGRTDKDEQLEEQLLREIKGDNKAEDGQTGE